MLIVSGCLESSDLHRSTIYSRKRGRDGFGSAGQKTLPIIIPLLSESRAKLMPLAVSRGCAKCTGHLCRQAFATLPARREASKLKIHHRRCPPPPPWLVRQFLGADCVGVGGFRSRQATFRERRAFSKASSSKVTSFVAPDVEEPEQLLEDGYVGRDGDGLVPVPSALQREGGASSLPDAAPSNRRLFKSINPPPKLLQHIRELGLGIPQKTGSRRRKLIRRIKETKKDASEGKLSYREERAFKDQAKLLDRSVPPPLPPPPPQPFTPNSRYPVKIVSEVSLRGDPFPPPNGNFPEVALAGRSNVGKSTLLNALLYGNQLVTTGSDDGEEKTDDDDDRQENNDKKASLSLQVRQNRSHFRNKTPEAYKLPKGKKAKVSSVPGETKKVAFYRLSSSTMKIGITLVDMPGFGFSYVGSATQDDDYSKSNYQDYQELAVDYVTAPREKALKRLLLLVDSRHGLKVADADFLRKLEKRVRDSIPPGGGKPALRFPPLQIVMTKADLVKQVDLARRVVCVKEELDVILKREYGNLPTMLVSAKPAKGYNNVSWKGGTFGAKGGILQLQREIASVLPFKK